MYRYSVCISVHSHFARTKNSTLEIYIICLLHDRNTYENLHLAIAYRRHTRVSEPNGTDMTRWDS